MSPREQGAAGGASVVRAGARLAATSATAAVVALRAGRLPRSETFELHRARALQDGFRAVLRHHGVEVEVRGEPPRGAVVLACNHVSWLDPVVVGAVVPCAPISKLDVRGWPVVGPLASRLGVIFHERGAQASGLRVLREAEESLRAGVPVLNFPEGTTTAGDTVLAFRKGLFGLAARMALPVVPVAVRYRPADLCWTGRDTFLPHYLRFAARRGSEVRLSFGEPVRPGEASDPSALAAAAREQVAALLEAA